MQSGGRRRAVEAAFAVWSFIGVPVAYLLYIDLSYRYALSHGQLPFIGGREWLSNLGLGICLATGGLCLSRVSVFRRHIIVWALTYLIAMGIILLVIFIIVAFGHGDSL